MTRFLPFLLIALIAMNTNQQQRYSPQEVVDSALTMFNASSGQEEFDESEACSGPLANKLGIQSECLQLGY